MPTIHALTLLIATCLLTPLPLPVQSRAIGSSSHAAFPIPFFSASAPSSPPSDVETGLALNAEDLGDAKVSRINISLDGNWPGQSGGDGSSEGMGSLGGGFTGLVGWLNPFGEGKMVVEIPHHENLTLPHRQSAFPAHLPAEASLPFLSAWLKPIELFPLLPTMQPGDNDPYGCGHVTVEKKKPRFDEEESTSSFFSWLSPMNKDMPMLQGSPPATPQIALVLRGKCSFSVKVLQAQLRGAQGVIVGDEALEGRSGVRETDEDGRRRKGLLTMYSPEDTTGILIPSTFVSRSTYLHLRDMFSAQAEAGEKVGLTVSVYPDESWEWPVTDMVFVVMLFPSILTIITILMNRYRMTQQRKAERAPPVAVLNLPERVWEPEDWEEKEEPAPGESTSETLPANPPPTIEDDKTASEGSPEASTSTSHIALARKVSHVKQSPPRFRQTECAICLSAFERGDMVRILPCGHVFHKDEVDGWLLSWKRVCPVCRADITTGTSQSSDDTPADGLPVQPDEDVERGLLQEARARVLGLGLLRRPWMLRWPARWQRTVAQQPEVLVVPVAVPVAAPAAARGASNETTPLLGIGN